MQKRVFLALGLAAGISGLAQSSGCTTAPAPATTDPNAITNSGLGEGEIPLKLDLKCPGDKGCEVVSGGSSGKLSVGTAKRDITPLVEPFVDANKNGSYDFGEPFTDLNGDGVFNPVWIAGYGSNRLAYGIHDPTWVKCFAIRQDNTTLAQCAFDAVGFFQNEQAQIRADLDPALGIDLFMASATHLHETQDTVGIWGPDDTTSGYDPAYMKRLRLAAVSAVTEAVHNMRPAKMSIGSILVEDPNHDLSAYVSDTRDPVVIDNRMHVIQFDGEDGKPIVTLLNWASHPESVGSDNHYITCDFTYWLRARLAEHTGSDVVFINASVGGQIGPGDVHPRDDSGMMLGRERSFRFARFWGLGLADFAMKAFDQRVMVDSPKLAFRHTSFPAHIENLFYQTGFRLKLFNRPVFGYDPHKNLLDPDNIPQVETEAAYITLGPASISTAPGELLPENFLGGYQGQYAGLYRFIDMTQPNSPDVTKAPKPPYLIDLMQGPTEHKMVWGLTLDFLGYIVPRYNFVLSADAPYLGRPGGDHYEETNSVGPTAEPEMVGTMRQLVMSANAESKK